MDHNDKLVSRDFTRRVLARGGVERLEIEEPDQFRNWTGKFRAPTKEEEEYVPEGDVWKSDLARCGGAGGRRGLQPPLPPPSDVGSHITAGCVSHRVCW